VESGTGVGGRSGVGIQASKEQSQEFGSSLHDVSSASDGSSALPGRGRG